MNLRNEVELVMEYSITTRTRVNHLDWAPCASSTPIRKPLNSLSNFETVRGHKECDALPRCNNVTTTASKANETNNYHTYSKKKIKRNKIKGPGSFYLPDCDEDDEVEDDIEDHPENDERKKNLIIKIGSNKFINKRSGWKGGNLSNVDSNAISTCNDVQLEKVADKEEDDNKSIVTCKSNQNYLKSKIVAPSEVSKVTELAKCPDNKTHPEIEKIAAESDMIIKNSVKDNDLPQACEFSKTQSKDVVSLVDIKYVKRKTKSPLQKDVLVKKLKHKQRCQGVLQCKGNQNNNDALENDKITENVERNDNKETSMASLTHHEIFSNINERVGQDSMDLSASDTEAQPNKVELKPECKYKRKKVFGSKSKLKHEIQNNVHLDEEHLEKVKLRSVKKHSENSEECEVENPEIMELDEIGENSGHCPDFSLESKSKASGNKNPEVDRSQLSHNSCNNEFVKDILGMKFNENCNGDGKKSFSYAFGWQFSSFKCCALKIGLKNEASGRTKHENSHFGGVLLKGRLLMKINGSEMKLKSGNMFCVPPLTDWKAINVGRTVCILYYWCGRF